MGRERNSKKVLVSERRGTTSINWGNECRRCWVETSAEPRTLARYLSSYRSPHGPPAHGASGDEAVPGATETGEDGCEGTAPGDKEIRTTSMREIPKYSKSPRSKNRERPELQNGRYGHM